jgi:DNA-binding NarL/FixJ family response regulator
LRVLIVHHSATTRSLLRAIVDSRQWKICGEAESGRAGVKLYEEIKPDLVLIDLALPDMSGIEVGKRMSDLDPTVPLILFTVLDVAELQTAARHAGICGVVSKAQAWDPMQNIETAVTRFLERKQQTPEISG